MNFGGWRFDVSCPFRREAPLRPRRRAAFTLIELVISSALMSVILVSAYLCLRAAVLGGQLVEARAEVVQNARVAMAIMSADLRCATPLSPEFEFLGMSRMLGGVEADNLDFATHNYTPQRVREGDFCEVSYFLTEDPETGRFSLWRRRDPSPDPEPLSGGTREEIAEGLRGLRFEYYDGWEWHDDWGDAEGRGRTENSLMTPGNLSGMPKAVRITVWFDPEPVKEKATKKATTEPPLVFETIVHLNLAGRSREGGGAAAMPSGVPGMEGGD